MPGEGVLHNKFIRGCVPQGFLLRPNPRNLVRYCFPIPEYMTDIDTQSKEGTKTIRRQRDKGLRAGNDYFGSKWPLERGSDLRTFFNTKILEVSSPETDHVLLENLSSCTFIQHPLQNFEYNSKPLSQKILSESIPQ